jgi:hypothetical protein
VQIDAIARSAGDTVELPDHDHLDPPGEDDLLKPIEFRTIQAPPALLVLGSLSRGRIDPVASEPALDLGLLTVGLPTRR